MENAKKQYAAALESAMKFREMLPIILEEAEKAGIREPDDIGMGHVAWSGPTGGRIHYGGRPAVGKTQAFSFRLNSETGSWENGEVLTDPSKVREYAARLVAQIK